MKNEPKQRDRSIQTDEEGSRAADASAHGGEPLGISRRRFLEAAGFTFSLAALNGCSRPAAELALPFVAHPEGIIPGRTQAYASTCGGCPAGCGLLAGVRDGRPLKMEGMPEHPLSRGGLCAIGQALPLGLYDSQRLQHPLQSGDQTDWRTVDEAIAQALDRTEDANGAVRFVTSTVTSPTLQASIDSFLARFKNARHITFDPVSCSAILDAHAKTHGTRILPHYRFDRADVIVSFGADFLGTWISPVEFTAGWRSRRIPTDGHAEMSFHVQCEGRVSLTGSNADRRYRVAPDEYGVVLNQLYVRLAEHAGQSPHHEALPQATIPDTDVSELADRLWSSRGQSLVVCDIQDVVVQVLVNGINHLLGNYGATLDIVSPSRQRQGNDRDVLELVDEVYAGQVSALFVAGIDLTYNLPDRDKLANAIKDIPLVVSFAERENDFAALARFVCPDCHPLESWMDAEPVSGIVSLSQPLLKPLGQSRPILESLARWKGRDESAYDTLRSSWEAHILARSEVKSFQTLWDQSLHDGFVKVSPAETAVVEFDGDAVSQIPSPPKTGEYCLTLYNNVGLTDSRHAHNPWLQELPDPVTKVTWDNYVSVSPATAEKLELVDGDLVRVATKDNDANVELPVLIQRGQHDRVVSIALNYGVKGTNRFANIGPQWLESRPTVDDGALVGKNAAPLINIGSGSIQLVRNDVTLTKTAQHRNLASTQEHHTLQIPPNVAPRGAEVRNTIQHTTLSEFAQNPAAGTPEQHIHAQSQLWPEDHPKDKHHWGMVIDLNACTGCSACLIACQSENNVPVVGKDEVRRQREMHWIRVDRYYDGDDDDLQVSHQPMMCQHCDNAPCETVCPVLATVHSDEGLNEQVYNRCVGTRYCANNCPYKVRRFNWFDYPHEDQLANLALNPDVTVRSRGVMEKCSMCVQRIEEGKIDARRRGEPVADGDILTACQQSCPAQAILFGDLNDADSSIAAALENPRRYGVLEEFNFRPTVSYLRVVKNRTDVHQDGGEHV